jgi:hypothetical protein
MSSTHFSLLWQGMVLFATAIAVSCGSSEAESLFDPNCTGNCSCSGTTCTCQSGGSCSLGPSVPDGGAGDAAVGISPPNGVTYHCDSQNQCNLNCGTGCTSTCDGQSTCSGSCSSNCTSSCAGTSDCTLSSVVCEGSSDCKLTLDDRSTVTCRGDSTCHIVCPHGGCTAECAGSTLCTIACGGGAKCIIQCNGMTIEECAAASTCSGVCDSPPTDDAGKSD